MAIKKRDPIKVIIFSILTLGIYYLYWFYQTRTELNELTGGKTSAIVWLILGLLPIVGFYVLWRYAQDVEKVSKGSQSKVLLFVLWLVLFPAAQYLTQIELNKFAK
ncbi:MAG: DUF4234 domain-containing protein [Candidatus Micrarchaeota archaeon]